MGANSSLSQGLLSFQVGGEEPCRVETMRDSGYKVSGQHPEALTHSHSSFSLGICVRPKSHRTRVPDNGCALKSVFFPGCTKGDSVLTTSTGYPWWGGLPAWSSKSIHWTRADVGGRGGRSGNHDAEQTSSWKEAAEETGNIQKQTKLGAALGSSSYQLPDATVAVVAEGRGGMMGVVAAAPGAEGQQHHRNSHEVLTGLQAPSCVLPWWASPELSPRDPRVSDCVEWPLLELSSDGSYYSLPTAEGMGCQLWDQLLKDYEEGSQRGGYIYTHSQFTLLCSRNEHNIVRQLSSD